MRPVVHGSAASGIPVAGTVEAIEEVPLFEDLAVNLLAKTPCWKPALRTSASVQPIEVWRFFHPDEAAFDDLVKALYSLLVDAPLQKIGIDDAPSESTCFSGPVE